MKWKRSRRRDSEIAPDEIFLDALNTSAFDRARFEGRLEKALPDSMFFWLSGALAILFLILIVRAWNLEITNGATFAAESARNALEVRTLFAPRGIITDFQGVVLVENTEKEDGSVRRNYLLPSMGQIIGYVSYPKKDKKGIYYDTSEIGLAGVEAEYNTLLTGKNGKLLTETDVFGNIRSEGVMVKAETGNTLRLSIDAVLEELLAEAISSTAKSSGFIAGAGAILDVHTGAVRALVSYPSYDPNVMSDGSTKEIAAYHKDPGHPFLDHATQGVYAPGSVVKPLVAAGALTDGIITPRTAINDPGFLSLPDPYNPGKNFIFKGWKALGVVTVQQAIAWSSDIFFYAVGGGYKNQKGLGIDRLEYWYRQFGLGGATGIDVPEEAGGTIPNPAWKQKVFNEPWYLGNTYFTTIGQYGMQVTPLQMARAIAAIANGGKLLTPSLLEGKSPVSSLVPASENALAEVRAGMRYCVTNALCSAVNFPYVKVAAKTGTAQTGTKNQYDNSWLVGFFPYENPQYAFAVVLERGPAGAGSRATTATRAFFEALHARQSSYVGGTATSTQAHSY